MGEARRFPDLDPDAFVHDEDRAALQALRRIPGIDAALRGIMNATAERYIHALKSHHGVRLGPTQYPTLWRMVERACETLDAPLPDAYLESRYQINATAFGVQRYTLTLYSGLVDLLEEEEVQAVVAHEIGHIKCDHMLYKSAAHALANFGLIVGARRFGLPVNLASIPIQLALLRWSRAAELSCDRAALLVVRDPEVVASVAGKLAGGSARYAHEFNLDGVLDQAANFEDEGGLVDRAFDAMQNLNLSHPDPIRRAREIVRWSRSEQYEGIVNGRYPRRVDGPGTCSASALLGQALQLRQVLALFGQQGLHGGAVHLQDLRHHVFEEADGQALEAHGELHGVPLAGDGAHGVLHDLGRREDLAGAEGPHVAQVLVAEPPLALGVGLFGQELLEARVVAALLDEQVLEDPSSLGALQAFQCRLVEGLASLLDALGDVDDFDVAQARSHGALPWSVVRLRKDSARGLDCRADFGSTAVKIVDCRHLWWRDDPE
jgi:Zn-dependent protease with chaperone function